MMSRRLEGTTTSPEDTQALGRAVGEALSPGALVLLIGELGAGKTTFVQGLAWGLGIEGYVRSPTFVFVVYHRGGRLLLHHIDLYRLDAPEEAQELGLEEYLEGEGACVVEWADRALGLFPADHLRVTLEHGGGAQDRRFRVEAGGPRHAEIVERVHRAWAHPQRPTPTAPRIP